MMEGLLFLVGALTVAVVILAGLLGARGKTPLLPAPPPVPPWWPVSTLRPAPPPLAPPAVDRTSTRAPHDQRRTTPRVNQYGELED